jgi:hypothetical protein
VTNIYRARSDAARAAYAHGDFEYEFASPTAEADALNSGLVELVPRPYLVTSDNFTVEGQPVWRDAVLTASFPIEIEAALIAGGHLVRADEAAADEADEAETPNPETP